MSDTWSIVNPVRKVEVELLQLTKTAAFATISWAPKLFANSNSVQAEADFDVDCYRYRLAIFGGGFKTPCPYRFNRFLIQA